MNELTKYIINSVMLLTVWSVALIVAIHYATKPTPAISPPWRPLSKRKNPSMENRPSTPMRQLVDRKIWTDGPEYELARRTT